MGGGGPAVEMDPTARTTAAVRMRLMAPLLGATMLATNDLGVPLVTCRDMARLTLPAVRATLRGTPMVVLRTTPTDTAPAVLATLRAVPVTVIRLMARGVVGTASVRGVPVVVIRLMV